MVRQFRSLLLTIAEYAVIKRACYFVHDIPPAWSNRLELKLFVHIVPDFHEDNAVKRPFKMTLRRGI